MCLKIYNLLGYKEHGFCYRKGAIFNENKKYQNSCQYLSNGICVWTVIEGKSKYIHMIDDFDCTKCGKCIAVCEEKAIIQISGKLPKLPNRLTKVGRFKKR